MSGKMKHAQEFNSTIRKPSASSRILGRIVYLGWRRSNEDVLVIVMGSQNCSYRSSWLYFSKLERTQGPHSVQPKPVSPTQRLPWSGAATPQVNGAETSSVCLLCYINFALSHSRREAASPFYLDALPIPETGYQSSQAWNLTKTQRHRYKAMR